MNATTGEDLVRELLGRGCITILTVDDRGDAARTRLFPGGDVINVVRRDVVGSPLLARHLADVQATLAALAALVARTEAVLDRLARCRRFIPAAGALVVGLGSGLSGLAPALWAVLAVLAWGLVRIVVGELGRRSARAFADRLMK